MAENARLRQDNLRLLVAWRQANDTTERVARRCAVLQRDAELLALMSRDRDVALGVLRDSHRIDQLPEGTL